MHEQESDLINGDKQYFYDRVASVRKKLEGLPAGSFIKKYFPLSRLDEMALLKRRFLVNRPT